MIKFRNPGSSIQTQVRIMKILDDVFYGKIFSLDDFAWAVTNNNMMTAYGYSGEAARELSNVEDESRNSTKMNVKMYAEIFRMLGWLSSWNADTSYPIVVTELGHYLANCPNPMALYRECVIGISSPQEMMPGVRYDEHVRFFACALDTMDRLGGIIYKHELCMGPMSVNDQDQRSMDSMVSSLRSARGSYSRYQAKWEVFCANQGMKQVSVDNQTRFPVGVLVGCGWADKVKSRDIYPPRTLQCLELTTSGREYLSGIQSCKDLRYEEFVTCNEDEQDALIRLGFYQMLRRAGYDLGPVAQIIEEDSCTISEITNGKELLFSPFQILRRSRVNKALGLDESSYTPYEGVSSSRLHQSNSTSTTLHMATSNIEPLGCGALVNEVVERITALNASGMSDEEICRVLFDDESTSNQDRFYPLIGAYFELLGFECSVSRQGDNGSRWDAIITGPGNAMPIEIKSPGEEEHLSIKGVKQALENKIMLLSRKTYVTSEDTASLVVGYKAPNDRAEVGNLIDSFYEVYGVSIGVISFDVLITLAVNRVLNNRGLATEDLEKVRGFTNAETL